MLANIFWILYILLIIGMLYITFSKKHDFIWLANKINLWEVFTNMRGFIKY